MSEIYTASNHLSYTRHVPSEINGRRLNSKKAFNFFSSLKNGLSSHIPITLAGEDRNLFC